MPVKILPMDLVLLGMKLKDDPLTYRKEYLEELRTFESLLNVPTPPLKQIKPILSFIVTNCHVDAAKSVELLVHALDAIRDAKARRSILTGFIIVRQKGHMGSRELFEYVLGYGSDLTHYLRGCQEYLETECYDLLVEWYRKGTEKQKSFCYYFLLVLFSRLPRTCRDDDRQGSLSVEPETVGADGVKRFKGNEDDSGSAGDSFSRDTARGGACAVGDAYWAGCRGAADGSMATSTARKEELESIICEAFFGSSKITKICMLYFLNRTEIKFDISRISHGAEYARRMYRELSETHLDRDIKIMKLRIFVLFKKHFNAHCSITTMVLKMIDLEKPDLGELLDCLVGSVERREAEGVYKILNDEFLNGNREDDVICYGFNVMREVYYRLAGLEKETALAVGEEDDSESEDETGSLDAGECRSGDGDPFLLRLKDIILVYISPFKGNRKKSIHYAYKALVKAVVRNETIDKPTTFVMKRKTKEEREEMRKKGTEGRKREIAKEQRERKLKKNRRGRIKNKKNRLQRPTKKKAKRS